MESTGCQIVNMAGNVKMIWWSDAYRYDLISREELKVQDFKSSDDRYPVVILGGVVAVAGQFNNWQIGIYAVAMGILVFLLEYPRGKRQKGKTVERRFQMVLTRLIYCCGPLTRNYFVRFAIHLMFCVPCCFILPTLLGGICLLITSIIYFVAALKGEQWKPVGLEVEKVRTGPAASISRPPKNPPPRAPVTTSVELNRV